MLEFNDLKKVLFDTDRVFTEDEEKDMEKDMENMKWTKKVEL